MGIERPRIGLARRVRPLAAVLLLCAPATPARAQVMDSQVYLFTLIDQLEVAPIRDGTPVTVDATAWLGGDVNRLWVRAEVDQETEREVGELQAEAFYGRLITPYWDALIGARFDWQWGEGSATLAYLALGLEGLAPLWFELEPTLYVSADGDVSGQLEAEYDLLLTQRLVLQPRFEMQLAVQSVPELGVGAGFNDLELGARLRFELWRELAPYVGVAWHRRFGETAELARAAGEYVSSVSAVVGLRVWY